VIKKQKFFLFSGLIREQRRNIWHTEKKKAVKYSQSVYSSRFFFHYLVCRMMIRRRWNFHTVEKEVDDEFISRANKVAKVMNLKFKRASHVSAVCVVASRCAFSTC
jgi:hypothetical protein